MINKIVLLKGGAATGKSTAFRGLRELKEREFKEWVFIDHPELKSWFNYLEEKREIQKRGLFALMKEIMKRQKCILLEEMSAETINKYLRRHIIKYNYKIITFGFITDNINETYKRDVLRVKNKVKHHSKTLDKKFIQKIREHHQNTFDKDTILINTSELNPKQVIKLICSKIR